jgi:hypothetical protein
MVPLFFVLPLLFFVPPPSAIENLGEILVARDLISCRIESLLNSRGKFLGAGDPGNVRCAVAGRTGAVSTQARRVFEEPLQDRFVTAPPAWTSRRIAHRQHSSKSARGNRTIWHATFFS